MNSSIGHHLGKGTTDKNTSDKEKVIYESRKSTLVKYRERVKAAYVSSELFFKKKEEEELAQKSSEQLLKQGEGLRKKNKNKKNENSTRIDMIPYSNIDDLVYKLNTFITAKTAGNTGLDNHINSILDELLRVGFLNKDDYDECYRDIFRK